MKIMFFCWAQEIQNEFLHATKYLSRFEQNFVLAPIIRIKDKTHYQEAITQLSEVSKNITVSPIYLKSPNSNFTNLLKPNIFISDFLSIVKAIRKSNPEVIVCFYISHAYPLALLKKLSNFALCTVAMGSDVNLENSFLQKEARKFIYRNCDLIFARSWKLKEKIEEEHLCKVIVSPSSTDTTFFRPLNYKIMLRDKWHISQDKQVILTVCRLDRNKAVDVLLKALQRLKENNVEVLIVGDGTERKNLEELTVSLKLQNKVTFLGLKNRRELLELYNLSDIFTLTSYSEGLPRVLIEAMACGCIPIVTNVGSISALTVDGYNGFTLPPGNYTALSEKIKNVLDLPDEEREKIQTKARQSVVEKFDGEKIWSLMVETIKASIPTLK